MTAEIDKNKSAPPRYAHGGGIDEAAQETGLAPGEILDFSASINPLGPPESVLAAVRESLGRLVHYPEVDAASFEREVADWHGLDSRQVLAGSGSTELIYLLPRALRPRRALLVAPCFSEYERALLQEGIPFDFLSLSPPQQFAFLPHQLTGALRDDTDMVWLANPGNPSGAAMPPAQVEEMARLLPDQVTLVVDEAFIDFAPEHSCTPLLETVSNLVVLRSMTKFYAIPGLRLGYLLGAPAVTEGLAQMRLPWGLSTPALAAGFACLKADAFRSRSLDAIPLLRKKLGEELTKLDLDVFDSATNFLLVQLPDSRSSSLLAAGMRHNGILVRDCVNFEGLDESFIRVAVRLEEENDRLIRALAEMLR
ncbi:MAG: threonine-phosphate decarboxylase CobD [Desulfuromonadales bacterium]